MLKVSVKNDEVRIGPRFSVAFQRTLRIPDDGRTYPLPPGLGRFPLHRVRDFAKSVPAKWRERGGFFLPMHQSEALWLAFDGAEWKPNAVQIAVGGINAVSGQHWEESLSAEPQNYIVCPNQLWLDGINIGNGVIRQFVAAPLGQGVTIEAQLTGKEELGGLQIRVYEPQPGRFPDKPPRRTRDLSMPMRLAAPKAGGAMGLGAGGRMSQKIYPDPYGVETWDQEESGAVFIHIINSEQYEELTERQAPPTPVSAETYTRYGFPWFELYDEGRATLAASEKLAKVKTIQEKKRREKEKSVKISPDQIKKIKTTKG